MTQQGLAEHNILIVTEHNILIVTEHNILTQQGLAEIKFIKFN